MAKNVKFVKRITVVYPEEMKTRFAGKTFRSYRAVALALGNGEAVSVAVEESIQGSDSWFLSGYGKIERNGNGFSFPRRLAHDY